jgi:hypothetical protein
MVMASVVAVLALILAMQNQDLQHTISDRFQTMTNVHNDESVADRIAGYKSVFLSFLKDPFGRGMGVTPAITEDASGLLGFVHGDQEFALQDSTVAAVLVTFGLAGALVWVTALFPLGRRLFWTLSVHVNSTRTLRAILVALLAEATLNNVFVGPTAFLSWAGVGFCIALGAPRDHLQPAISAVSLAPEYASVAL